MTKSELRTGMIVTRRDGHKLTVYRNCITANGNTREQDVIVDASSNSWLPLECYDEDLTNNNGYTQFDIVKVELVHHPYDFNKYPCNATTRKTLWERKEVKKITISEIEKILGYKVEIINDK